MDFFEKEKRSLKSKKRNKKTVASIKIREAAVFLA
jgi:hypothetical protein